MALRIYDPLNPVPVYQEQNAFESYLNVENESMAAEGYATSKEATLRKIAVRVILENSRWDNYDAFVPYLALIYFDCFISHNPLPNLLRDLREEVVLIANSCLKIAYEMRDSTFRPLDFLKRTRMIEHEIVILRMELAIISGIDWKTRAVTAICFVNMFVRMIPEARRIKQRTLNEIVIQAQGDIEFTKFRPSVIAAAAILSACKLKYKENDMYYNCYKFLLGLKFVHEEELNACTKKTTEMCIYKRIVIEEDEPGSSSEAGGSSSSRTGKEPLQGISGTKDAKVQKMPGKKPRQGTAIRHRRGRRQLPTIEETEDETEIGGEESVSDIPEILPVRRIEDIDPMNFELKWILWDADAGETTIDSSLFRPGAEITPGENDNPFTASATNVSAHCCRTM
ncbi:uncharacterized protein LOC116138492 [Pistacia vera]|uniref:uncharacterized protein LOC116138492 n=1 Tax=Pistacia vera TaxID=55513 RepID=UPI0012635E40|nr:uncharacterized protein LOC116138492 [Pistacia vera]